MWPVLWFCSHWTNVPDLFIVDRQRILPKRYYSSKPFRRGSVTSQRHNPRLDLYFPWCRLKGSIESQWYGLFYHCLSSTAILSNMSLMHLVSLYRTTLRGSSLESMDKKSKIWISNTINVSYLLEESLDVSSDLHRLNYCTEINTINRNYSRISWNVHL